MQFYGNSVAAVLEHGSICNQNFAGLRASCVGTAVGKVRGESSAGLIKRGDLYTVDIHNGAVIVEQASGQALNACGVANGNRRPEEVRGNIFSGSVIVLLEKGVRRAAPSQACDGAVFRAEASNSAFPGGIIEARLGPIRTVRQGCRRIRAVVQVAPGGAG